MTQQNATALIIGGSGGIGQATAYQLKQHNFQVVLAGRNEAKLAKAAEGTDFYLQVIDVTNTEQIKAGFTVVQEKFGSLDLLVNAAGVRTRLMPLPRLQDADWDEQHAIHSRGCFLTSQQALKMMRKQKFGTVVNIASVAAKAPVVPGYAAYGAAKAAMVNLTMSLNKEGNPYGVRATALCPTYVDTPLWEGVDMANQQLLTPDVIAKTILFLWQLPQNVLIQELTVDVFLPSKVKVA